MTFQPVILIPAAGLLLALVLLWLGRRGRRTDDHPVCRRCGFDLYGLPKDAERCPECGNLIAAPRAVRVGNRQRRPIVLVGGGVLLLLSLASLYLVERGTLSQVDWPRYEPAWWLIRRTSSGNAATRDEALAELVRRIDEHELATSDIDRLVDTGLEYQQKVELPWIDGWGQIVEEARSAGHVSDEQWRRYAEQAANLSLVVRPKIRRGDALVLGVRLAPPRVGKIKFPAQVWYYGHIDLASRSKSESWVVVELAERTSGLNDFLIEQSAAPNIWTTSLSDESMWESLPDGPTRVRNRTEMQIFAPGSDPHSPQLIPLVKKGLDMRTSFMLSPADEPTVTLRNDAEDREAMRKWAKSGTGATLYWSKEFQQLSFQANWDPLPTDCAFKLYVKTGVGERAGCDFVYRTGDSIRAGHSWQVISFSDDDHVDIILRPCAVCAARTLDITGIWGEEIVLHNVPVTRQ